MRRNSTKCGLANLDHAQNWAVTIVGNDVKPIPGLHTQLYVTSPDRQDFESGFIKETAGFRRASVVFAVLLQFHHNVDILQLGSDPSALYFFPGLTSLSGRMGLDVFMKFDFNLRSLACRIR